MEKVRELFSYTMELFEIEKFSVSNYSALVFAFIGDAVYEAVVRTIVVSRYNTRVNKLHNMSSNLAKASTQAKIIISILDVLTQEELAVYKRGRNAKTTSMAKNASMKDYKMATGFEALIGYLYLTEQSKRMMELIKSGLENLEECTV